MFRLAIAPRTSFYSMDYLAEGGSLFEQPSNFLIEEACGLLVIEIFLIEFLSKTALWNGLSADTRIYCHADGKVVLRRIFQKCCFALVTLIFSVFAYKVLQNSMFEITYFFTYSTYFRHILYYIFQIFKHILLSALVRITERALTRTNMEPISNLIGNSKVSS